MVSYIRLFSPGNVAMLSDWLAENNELYVNVYHPNTGDHGDTYLVRSLPDLKSLVKKQNWPEISFTIYRPVQLKLRGTVDDAFIEQAMQTIEDGQEYEIVGFVTWPKRLEYFSNGGISHEELRRDLEENRGRSVALGSEPAFSLAELRDLENTLEVHSQKRDQGRIGRNQDRYAPYDSDPQRYRWIKDVWRD